MQICNKNLSLQPICRKAMWRDRDGAQVSPCGQLRTRPTQRNRSRVLESNSQTNYLYISGVLWFSGLVKRSRWQELQSLVPLHRVKTYRQDRSMRGRRGRKKQSWESLSICYKAGNSFMHFPLTGRRVTSLSPRVHKDTGKTRISWSKLARQVVTRLVMDQGKAQAGQMPKLTQCIQYQDFWDRKKKKRNWASWKVKLFPRERCLWWKGTH